jgi:hypothetical protein
MELELTLTDYNPFAEIVDTPRCKCTGVLDYVYHSWWRCRLCGKWWDRMDPDQWIHERLRALGQIKINGFWV